MAPLSNDDISTIKIIVKLHAGHKASIICGTNGNLILLSNILPLQTLMRIKQSILQICENADIDVSLQVEGWSENTT
jgi:hypothetical protein